MSRIYATVTVDGEEPKRKLVRLECDSPGCGESIKPYPDIASSGWTSRGHQNMATRETARWDYCPTHGATE